MASMDWQKLKTSSQVKAIIRHNDKDKRLEGNHKNEDINKDQTHLNTQTVNYEDACRRYTERIYDLDQRPGANTRKDRVTACMLCTSVPEGLPEDKEDEWIRKTTDIIAHMIGKSNMIGTWTHRDEKHEYIDRMTKEQVMSRTHVHIMIVPESNGKLDAKHVCSRSNFIKLNKEIDEMTRSDYDLDYMNGKGSTKLNINTLKQLSNEAQREKEHQQAIMKLQEQQALLENEIERYRTATQMYLDRVKELDEEKYENEKQKLEHDRLYRQTERESISPRKSFSYFSEKKQIFNKDDEPDF